MGFFKLFPVLTLWCLFVTLASGSTDSKNLHNSTTTPTKPCYVNRSNVTALIQNLKFAAEVFMFTDKRNLQCLNDVPVLKLDAAEKSCTEGQIERVRQDLKFVAQGILNLALNGMNKTSEVQVQILEVKKAILFDNLRALRVLYSPSTFVYTFQPLVRHVENNFNCLLDSFKPPVPVPAATTTPSTAVTVSNTTLQSYNLTTTTATPTTSAPVAPPCSAKPFAELSELAFKNAVVFSSILPDLIPILVHENATNLDQVTNFIEGLPTLDQQIIGFSAIYDIILKHPQLFELPRLLKLAGNLERLNDSVATTSKSVPTAARFQLAEMVHNLSPLILIGEAADCHIVNVAYELSLVDRPDRGWPKSMYLFPDKNLRYGFGWRFTSAVKNNTVVFQIQRRLEAGWGSLFASDVNRNLNTNATYRVNKSERYVLHSQLPDPRKMEVDWSLVPVEVKLNQFKIAGAKSDDFLFAHNSAMGVGQVAKDYRRVLLGRSNFTVHDFVCGADVWALECQAVKV